jgi:hypothetical protein
VLAWATTPPAQAQVPIIDNAATANAGQTFANLTAEVQKYTAFAAQMSSVLNVQHDISAALGLVGLGQVDIGGITVGQLVQTMQMGFQSIQQAKNTAEQIVGEVHNLSSDPIASFSPLSLMQQLLNSTGNTITAGGMSAQVATAIQAMNQVEEGILSMPNAITSVEQAMFLSVAQPTSAQIQAVAATRQAVSRQLAIQGLQTASAWTQPTTTQQDPMQSLATGIANSTDERGDIKANSAIWLKVLEQQEQQNGILANILSLRSAHTIAAASTFGPLAGTSTSGE